MNNLIKSILKTAVYFLDQTDRFTDDLRDRVSDTVERAGDRVSDRANGLMTFTKAKITPCGTFLRLPRA